jgi:hypothetical protein
MKYEIPSWSLAWQDKVAAAIVVSWILSPIPSQMTSRQCVRSGLFPSGFHIQNLYAFLFSPMHTRSPTHLALSDLSILIIFDKDSRHAVSYSLLSCQPSSVQIFSSSQISLVCVPPVISETNFTFIQKYRQNYSFIYSNFTPFGKQREDKRFWTEW